ncbi:MAG: sodium:solute symporter family protein [Pelotomaculum sp.]|nr:sodium:solute symporter family protein [Pelotomaculum sp.]
MELALSGGHVAGFIIAVAGVTALGIYAGRMVGSAQDFSVGGRRAGAAVVTGTIMGTLVGGSATIGTAQLAFKYGLCAWWFTLGAGIGCFVLGLGYARRLRAVSLVTVPQYLTLTYGSKIGPVSSLLSCSADLFGITSQGLAAVALLASMFNISPYPAVVACAVLVLSYVVFGGVWGAGLVGVAKVVLVYLAAVVSGALAYKMAGGWSGLTAVLPPYPWFSFFGRGVGVDLAAGFSLVVGVASTQTYIQSIFSARNLAEARKGVLLSGILIPPLGAGGVLVGLYMRVNFPETASDQVLPAFIIKFLPPVLAGVMLAALLIVVIGTWAGITLGMSTTLTEDIYRRLIRPAAGDREILAVHRVLMLTAGLLSVLMVIGNLNSLIMKWSVMSLALRACALFFPLLGALFFPGAVTPLAGTLAALLGPLTGAVWYCMYPGGIDPVYPGLLASLLTLLAVSRFSRRASSSAG